jgi:DNA helicase II / ATP-dependent DNA helicase PcrA
MKAEQPTLVIAGPGSGKTTDMVKEIVKSLPELEPHRFLATITYTNAATNTIKERLSQHTKIPANVFVGTTYAFFNKFLVLPYGTLLPRVTENKNNGTRKEDFIGLDKLFFELDEKKLIERLRNRYPNWNSKDAQQKQKLENAFVNELVRNGKIPFNKITSIASYLIKDYKIVREIVGNRLQFLFVDEFQDADNQQFQVFDEIRKFKRTKIYKVGDAEQFISNFSAGFKNFSKIPIIQHQNKCEVKKNLYNNRCSSQITAFINNFNTQLQQDKTRFSTINKNGVFFISQTDLLQISNTFKQATEIWKCEPDFKRFYLSYKNKTFDDVANQLGLIKISNDSKKPHHLLSEVINIITKIEACNQKQICEKYNINIVQLRTLAIKLWKKDFNTIDKFKTYFEQELKLSITLDLRDILNNYEDLKNLKHIPNNQKQTEFTTSIHKSKGLEATCVLVVATTNNELEKWLETNHKNRIAIQCNKKGKEKAFEDNYRLGFVAFSRAKVALHLACLQAINEANKKKLEELNVLFVK